MYLPDAAKPAPPRASARREDIALLDVHSRLELMRVDRLSRFALVKRRLREFHGRNMPPVLREFFSFRLVSSKRNVNVNLVGLREKRSGGPKYANSSSGLAFVLRGKTRINRRGSGLDWRGQDRKKHSWSEPIHSPVFHHRPARQRIVRISPSKAPLFTHGLLRLHCVLDSFKRSASFKRHDLCGHVGVRWVDQHLHECFVVANPDFDAVPILR